MKKTLLKTIFVLAGLFVFTAMTTGCNPEVKQLPKYSSPFTINEADPWVYHHSDGYYYYTASYGFSDDYFGRIIVRKAKTIMGLKTAKEYTIGQADSGWMAGVKKYLWAPELHFINGSWYLFFTGCKEGVWTERNFVAKCDGDDPITGKWSLAGSNGGRIRAYLSDDKNHTYDIMDDTNMALDGAPFEIDGQWYYVWNQYIWDNGWADEVPGDGTDLTIGGKTYTKHNNANWAALIIGKMDMEDPGVVTDCAVISVPEYTWECGLETVEFDGKDYKFNTYTHTSANVNVNEGPAFLIRGSKIFVVYSASSCDEAYSLGLLTADISKTPNLCDIRSWTKDELPVFTTSVRNAIYGVGHCSFTQDDEGNDLIIYHARNYHGLYAGSGVGGSATNDGLSDGHRSARVKIFTWKDGKPFFGEAE